LLRNGEVLDRLLLLPTARVACRWTILRIWNNELAANPEGVFEAIVQRAADCLGGTHPHPLPSREGRKRRTRDP
jgi:ATP-dependent 26S proteasome regulatory subunit